MGPWTLGARLAKPGAGVACEALHETAGTPALAVFIPTPAERDIPCERLYSATWRDCLLTGLDGVTSLHHAELLPQGPGGGWTYAAVVQAHHPEHTISRFVARHGPLSPLNALRFLKLVARVLVGLEQRRMCHGYLTPEQVVLDGAGRPLLTHPVVARAERSFAGLDRVPHGFIAPELLDGGEPSMATDCYAAGALLHLVATGKPPMAGLDISEFHPELLASIDTDPIRSHRGLDPAVLGIIRQAMAVRPHERIATAIDLLHAVERAQTAVVETRDGFEAVDEDERIGGTSAWCRPATSEDLKPGSGVHRRRTGRTGRAHQSGVRSPRTGRVARTGSGVRPPRTGRIIRRTLDDRTAEALVRRPVRGRAPSPLVWLYLVAAIALAVIAVVAVTAGGG